MKYRRAGHHEAAPTPCRARRAVEPSTREVPAPGRGGAIRGLAEVVEARRQLPESWRETWADEIAKRESGGERP